MRANCSKQRYPALGKKITEIFQINSAGLLAT